ncbi:MAG: CoA pyrophosphatase [Deltaproteobacteria bacterium]|nr:CoA pyrophosphatase [Deltaproteobacteria bacterium]
MASTPDTLDATVAALRATLAARARKVGAPPGHPAHPAATLVLLQPGPGGPALVFTRRPQALRSHAGQISFPGGQRSAADADAAACALREAAEELGLDPATVEVLGLLDDVLTPTGFLVTPVVACLRSAVEYRPSPAEVAEVFAVPVARLRDPVTYRSSGSLAYGGVDYALHEYHYEGRVIWGVTARMVHQLLERWPA